MAIPRNNPEISPICEGICSCAIAMVTANEDQSRYPKANIQMIRIIPWVIRIPANAGIDAIVVITTTFFLPIRSERIPPLI